MADRRSSTSVEAREQRGRNALAMELVLVRHAEPDWELARRTGEDPALTELGRRQAAALAAHLRPQPLAALYCSPLRRAGETAAALAAALELVPTVVDDLAEIHVPLLATEQSVEEYFAAASRRPLRQHWDGFPGGEPFRDFHARVTRALESLLAHYGVRPQPADEFTVWTAPARAHRLRLGIVGHGGTNGVILTHLLGIASVPWEWMRFETPLAAYSVLGLRPLSEEGYLWSLQQFGRRIAP